MADTKHTKHKDMNDRETTNSEAEAELTVTHSIPLVPQLAIALGLLMLIFGASYIPFVSQKQEAQIPTNLETRILATTEEEPSETDQFQDVILSARAAYVWDIKNQRALYNKNASAQLPLASLTKLMTALVASEHMTEDEYVEITAAALRQDGGSGFGDGQLFAFRDLIDLTLITSSNDGAYALAAAAGNAIGTGTETSTDLFIETMNKKAEEIGLAQTFFTNPTGLDTNEFESGSYGSARDMAFLMEHIVTNEPEMFERTNESLRTITDASGVAYTAENTNVITGKIPGLIASKTGYTDLAGGNLVVAFDVGFNHPVVIAVLGSTREGRFSDVQTLVNLARETTTR